MVTVGCPGPEAAVGPRRDTPRPLPAVNNDLISVTPLKSKVKGRRFDDLILVQKGLNQKFQGSFSFPRLGLGPSTSNGSSVRKRNDFIFKYRRVQPDLNPP